MLNQNWRKKYGTWAVVTGASDGIGREMALCLAEAGFNLVLVARRSVILTQLASDLTLRFGIETCVLEADLTQPEAVKSVLEATHGLEVGLFVACAGFGTSGWFIESTLENELAMLDVNCRAVLTMTHAFARRFAQQKRGGIVLMSSLLAFQGVPRAAHYAATKAYIQSFAEGLHAELTPLGVDVIASAPGPIQSGFAARANMQMGVALTPDQVALATLQALGRKRTVRPGWLSKFLEGSLATLPRIGRTWALGKVMQGMTAHQNS